MLELLVKWVFTIITKIYTIILSPFFSAIFVLFPDLRTAGNYVLQFFQENIFPLVTFCVTVLHNVTGLPVALVVFLFDYLLVKYSIFLILMVFSFAENMYKKFKP